MDANIITMLYTRLAVHTALTELAVHMADPNPNPNSNLNVYCSFCEDANLRIDDLWTKLLVDKSVHEHDNSQTANPQTTFCEYANSRTVYD